MIDIQLTLEIVRGLVGYHNTTTSRTRTASLGHYDSDSGASLMPTPNEDYKTSQQMVFVVTSPEKEGLIRLAETYSKFLETKLDPGGIRGISNETERFKRLAYTLSEHRTIFDWRSFIVADSTASLRSSLEAGLPKFPRVTKEPRCGFLFTGQGAQWFAMGRELQAHAIFRKAIEEADTYISSLGSAWSVVEELNRDKESSRVNEPEISQPLCTVLQIALVTLLRHWGVVPKSVSGHSSGEIAAGYTVGAIRKEDAWKIAYYRGLRSGMIPYLAQDRTGAMMAVALPESETRKYLRLANIDENDQVIVACINSPESVTVSGDASAIENVKGLLLADNIWCRKLQVKTAYHSQHMAIIADQYLDDIKDVIAQPCPASISIFSSVTGAKIDGAEMGPEYWIRNLVSPVRFSDAVTALVQPQDNRRKRKRLPDVDLLIELGPHAALQGPVMQILVAASQSYANAVTYLSILKRGSDAETTALDAAGRLWGLGLGVDLSRVNSVEEAKPRRIQHLVDLPPYPFNHNRRHWYESSAIRNFRQESKPRTDLLGMPAATFTRITPIWRNIISPAETPWLLDHHVHKLLLMPGAVFLAMALEGCREVADPNKSIEGYEFRDVLWHKPIILESPDSKIATLMQFSPHHHGTKASWSTWTRFSLTTKESAAETVEHCSGLIQVKYALQPDEVDNGFETKQEWEEHKRKYEEIRCKPTMVVPVKGIYDKLGSLGLQFGPTFRNLHSINAGDGYGFCEIKIPDTAASMPESFEYPLPVHPTLIDAAFQALTCTTSSPARGSNVMLPSAIGSLYISAAMPNTPGTLLKGYVTRVFQSQSQNQENGTVVLSDSAWAQPLIVLKNIVTSAAPAAKENSNRRPFGRIDWIVDSSHCSAPVNETGPLVTNGEVADFDLDDQAAAQLIQKAFDRHIFPESYSTLENPAMNARRLYSNWMQSLQPLACTEVTAEAASEAVKVIGANMASILTSDDQSALLTDEFMSRFAMNDLNRSCVDKAAARILMQAGHVNPHIRVLEVGIASLSSGTLRHLKDKISLIGKYTVTRRDKKSLEVATSSFGDLPTDVVDFKTLNIEQNVKNQGFEAGIADYVILDDLTLATSNLALALRAIKLLLKPNGKLIIQTITKAQMRTAFVLGSSPRWWRDQEEGTNNLDSMRLDEARWNELLKKNGFTGVNYAVSDLQDPAARQISVLLSSTVQELPFEATEAVVLCPSNPSKAVAQLIDSSANNLHQLGIKYERATWETISDVEGKVIICFLELDDALLPTMKEDLFLSIQHMVLKTAGMLWITRGGYISGESLPAFSMSTGFFRAIRSESSTRRMFTLDLSLKLDLSLPRAIEIVIDVCKLLWDFSDTPTQDWEFAEDQGLLHVPRLVADTGLNAADASEVVTSQDLMEKLFQKDRPLKMTIGQMGSLDSLHFIDNDEFKQGELLPDWVDIEVQYTGMTPNNTNWTV